MGEYFTSGLFCPQRKHLACEYFRTFCFSRGGVVSASPNLQAGRPPLVGRPRLLIQFIRSYPPYRRPFLHPQPEDAPCRGDRDPQKEILHIQIYLSRNSVSVFKKNPNKCDGHATKVSILNPALPLNRSADLALSVFEESHHVVNGSTCQ